MIDFFDLPDSCHYGKVIPKNSFDKYGSAKEKKMLTDLVARMSWTHKLAPYTINLPGKNIIELQVIHIELKRKVDIDEILSLVDKYAPYSIVFVVQFGEEVYVSATVKHTNPSFSDCCVLDLTFKSDWISVEDFRFVLNLSYNLDFVFFDLCKQLSPFASSAIDSLEDLIAKTSLFFKLDKEVKRLRAAVASCKQFNRKVELNLELNQIQQEISKLLF
ncbi:DUF4391 domain-containing protein [Sphingobacterium sp. xlx-130]|uniref:DUF4391 domain-containing protein n=1 Tax=Sphingobacterium sp. xlx-130 TaxID=2654323 RepID=UPI0013D99FD4|nr:DUF4391 domain-containing protein [Sphingobacterium sp. xlx-130]